MNVRIVKAKLQGNSHIVTAYYPEQRALVLAVPESIVGIETLQVTLLVDNNPEVHFSDVSINEEWKEAGYDISKPLPMTGNMSVRGILALFQYIFKMIKDIGLSSINTSCRCEKRRRVYLMAAKRLGVHAVEVGEVISFTM